jgi:uncharacterized membrane protein YbhN (UPF0104 family)
MAVKRRTKSPSGPHVWRRVIILFIIVLLGYLLISQVKSLSPGLRIIRHAQAAYVLLGLLLTIATFFVAGIMYQLLSLHPLGYGKTLLIQAASGFANRLLPAGLGGIGLVAQYLRTQKHTTSEALTVVGADNVIGIIGHFSLFFVVVAFGRVSFATMHLPHIPRLVLLGLVALLVLLGCLSRTRAALRRATSQVGHNLMLYRKHPLRFVLAFLNSVLLTILYVSILWACTYAVGEGQSFPKVLVVFTAGSIIGNVTPTPGGLVGTEAGLFGGFFAYGLSSGAALAAALLYRLLTYWLPIVPGVIAFWIAQRRLKLIA